MNNFCYLLLILCVAGSLNAKIIYVDGDQPFLGGDGTSWQSPYKQLQDALSDADNTNDEIWIKKGTYPISSSVSFGTVANVSIYDQWMDFPENSESDLVRIYGGFEGNETSIDQRDPNNRTVLRNSINVDSEGPQVWLTTDRKLYIYDIDFKNCNLNVGGRCEIILENCSMAGISGINLTTNSQYTQVASFSAKNCEFKDIRTNAHTGSATNYVQIFKGIRSSLSKVNLENCTVVGTRYETISYNLELAGGTIFSRVGVEISNSAFINNIGIGRDFLHNSSGVIVNCIFYNNAANTGTNGYSTGFGFYDGYTSNDELLLYNCTFTKNSWAPNNYGSSGSNRASLRIFNCIFDDDVPFFKNNSGGMPRYANFSNSLSDEYVQDSSQRSKNYFKNGISFLPETFNIGSIEFALSGDVGFTNVNNVYGDDGILFTSDDGLTLSSNSSLISQGNPNVLPLDNNSYDIRGLSRISNGAIDLGAYQSPAQYSLIINYNTLEINLTLDPDKSLFDDGEAVSVNATPIPGYILGPSLESLWNNRQIIMDSDKTFTITSNQDSNDSDFDGLSNYQEIIVYGTDEDVPDTSGDGVLDGEIVGLGFDPTTDYSDLLNLRPTQASYDAVIAERDAKLTLAEVADLRPGSTLIEVSGNQATVQLQMEESSDLQTWEDTGDPATMTIPADTDTKFFRFKMAD